MIPNDGESSESQITKPGFKASTSLVSVLSFPASPLPTGANIQAVRMTDEGEAGLVTSLPPPASVS